MTREEQLEKIYAELEDKIAIDTSDLSGEWCANSMLSYTASDVYTDLVFEKNRFELKHRRLVARKSVELRAKEEGKRVTEGHLQDMLVLEPEVQRSREKLQELEYLVDRWYNLASTLRNKSKSLDKVTELYQSASRAQNFTRQTPSGEKPDFDGRVSKGRESLSHYRNNKENRNGE